jgi:hypothetical protein
MTRRAWQTRHAGARFSALCRRLMDMVVNALQGMIAGRMAVHAPRIG